MLSIEDFQRINRAENIVITQLPDPRQDKEFTSASCGCQRE